MLLKESLCTMVRLKEHNVILICISQSCISAHYIPYIQTYIHKCACVYVLIQFNNSNPIASIYFNSALRSSQLHRGTLPLHCPLDWQVLLFGPSSVQLASQVQVTTELQVVLERLRSPFVGVPGSPQLTAVVDN